MVSRAPRRSRASARCEPMNPAPPVSSTLCLWSLISTPHRPALKISEMVTHGKLELASRESGVGFAECRRGDYTVVLFKIRVVENVESVPGKVNEVGMLPLRENPPAFRHAQIKVYIACGASSIAPNARGTVVKNGIVVVIVSGGDVVGKARPSVNDSRNLKTEPQGMNENHIESMPAIEARAAPVAVRVVIIGRRIKEPVNSRPRIGDIVQGAREHILRHDVQFMHSAFIGDR